MNPVDINLDEPRDGLESLTPLAWLILAPFLALVMGWAVSAALG